MVNLSKEEKRVLHEIYVGQNIRSEGILKSRNQETLVIIKELINRNLVKQEPNFYKNEVLKTTDEGSILGKEIIQEILNENKQGLLKEIRDIPESVLAFLLFDYYPEPIRINHEKEYSFEWKEFLINRDPMKKQVSRLVGIVDKYDLLTKTNHYVSTKNKEIQDLRIIFPYELKDFLVNNQVVRNGMTETAKTHIKLFYLLDRLKDIMRIDDQEIRRRNYWTILQETGVEERQIEKIINEFANEGITTRYASITNENFLFQMGDKNSSRYYIKLEKLVNDYLVKLFEPKSKPIAGANNAEGNSVINRSLDNQNKAYNLLRSFEFGIRKFIIDRLSEEGEGSIKWHDKLDPNLLKRLKDKEKDYKDQGKAPEENYLSYAFILDYKKIILRSWNLYFKKNFENAGVSKERFEHEMDLINDIRNTIMHYKVLTDPSFNTLELILLPDISKLWD